MQPEEGLEEKDGSYPHVHEVLLQCNFMSQQIECLELEDATLTVNIGQSGENPCSLETGHFTWNTWTPGHRQEIYALVRSGILHCSLWPVGFPRCMGRGEGSGSSK